MKSGLDFLIEIYPEDGFLAGEICFEFRVRLQNPKSGFPNRTQPD